jgi:cytochrome c biogenesis protein CcmG/thiol:disulfide interchange protein DsbE
MRAETMTMRRWLFLSPAVLFTVVAGYFFWGLNPERDPRAVPSALIDKPVPAFELPPRRSTASTGPAWRPPT